LPVILFIYIRIVKNPNGRAPLGGRTPLRPMEASGIGPPASLAGRCTGCGSARAHPAARGGFPEIRHRNPGQHAARLINSYLRFRTLFVFFLQAAKLVITAQRWYSLVRDGKNRRCIDTISIFVEKAEIKFIFAL